MPNESSDASYLIDNDIEKLSHFNRLEKCKNETSCPYEQCKFASNEPCTDYIFDKSEIKLTAVEDVFFFLTKFYWIIFFKWKLTCGDNYVVATVQMTYYVGQMFGSLLFGYLGDR